MKWTLSILGLVVAIALLCVDWRGKTGRTVNVIGSTSIQPFAEMLAEEFNEGHPGLTVDVQGGGSTAGIQAIQNRIADIGMCSRSLKRDEPFTATVIANDGLAVVVHRGNPVAGLTTKQVHDMFAGRITNWKEVGGEDRGIRLITREEGSGTREAFQKLVMEKGEKARISRKALTQESNGAVGELVKHDPAAIGYMSLGLVGKDLKALVIDGVHPLASEVTAKRYPLVRPFLFATRGAPEGDAKKWIDFVLSPEAQAMLEREGLVRAR